MEKENGGDEERVQGTDGKIMRRRGNAEKGDGTNGAKNRKAGKINKGERDRKN